VVRTASVKATLAENQGVPATSTGSRVSLLEALRLVAVGARHPLLHDLIRQGLAQDHPITLTEAGKARLRALEDEHWASLGAEPLYNGAESDYSPSPEKWWAPQGPSGYPCIECTPASDCRGQVNSDTPIGHVMRRVARRHWASDSRGWSAVGWRCRS
jgi:hypothetical protein